MDSTVTIPNCYFLVSNRRGFVSNVRNGHFFLIVFLVDNSSGCEIFTENVPTYFIIVVFGNLINM